MVWLLLTNQTVSCNIGYFNRNRLKLIIINVIPCERILKCLNTFFYYYYYYFGAFFVYVLLLLGGGGGNEFIIIILNYYYYYLFFCFYLFIISLHTEVLHTV